MLVNNKIIIDVTNDGEINKVSLSLNEEDTILDILACIEMGNKNLKSLLSRHIKNKGEITEEKLRTITIKELYATK